MLIKITPKLAFNQPREPLFQSRRERLLQSHASTANPRIPSVFHLGGRQFECQASRLPEDLLKSLGMKGLVCSQDGEGSGQEVFKSVRSGQIVSFWVSGVPGDAKSPKSGGNRERTAPARTSDNKIKSARTPVQCGSITGSLRGHWSWVVDRAADKESQG